MLILRAGKLPCRNVSIWLPDRTLLEILNKCDKLNVDFSKATIGKAREEILNLIRGK